MVKESLYIWKQEKCNVDVNRRNVMYSSCGRIHKNLTVLLYQIPLFLQMNVVHLLILKQMQLPS